MTSSFSEILPVRFRSFAYRQPFQVPSPNRVFVGATDIYFTCYRLLLLNTKTCSHFESKPKANFFTASVLNNHPLFNPHYVQITIKALNIIFNKSTHQGPRLEHHDEE